jgi:hypothetical protein
MAGWLIWGIDLALVILVAECAALAFLIHRRGRNERVSAFLAMAMAGFALILALRVALVDGPLWLVAILLMLGGIAHLIDLKSRIQSHGL